MNTYLYLFLLFALLTACDGITTGSSSQNSPMHKDAIKVIDYYCKGQAKQVEISRKMSEYTQKGQSPPEEIMNQMDEANKYMELYTNALQEIMNKYKGQERAVQNILKKGYDNCKW